MRFGRRIPRESHADEKPSRRHESEQHRGGVHAVSRRRRPAVAVTILAPSPVMLRRRRRSSSASEGGVVVGAPAVVEEDLVGLGSLLELEGGGLPEVVGGLGVAVRVELERGAAEGLLDLLLGGAATQP